MIYLSIFVNVIFLIALILLYLNNKSLEKDQRLFDEQLKHEREDAIKRSKSIIKGNISQELVPLFPDFPYNMSDIKFSGQPLDYLVFKGMTDFRNGKAIEIEIIFADVKTNKAQRTKVQNALKKAIEEKRVKFETWTIDSNNNLKIK